MIAICDDDKHDAEELKQLIQKTREWQAYQFQIYLFYSAEAILQEISRGTKFSMIFLDILLGGNSRGNELAKQILQMDHETEIVFQTNSLAFALDAYELDALHYLVKPLTVEQIDEVFKRYRRKHAEAEVAVFQNGKSLNWFRKDSIIRVVSERKGVHVYERDGKEHWFNMSFQNVMKQLGTEQFIAVSRGYLVNMEYIHRIESGRCFLLDGTEILLSRKSRAEIRQHYYDYLFRHGGGSSI